MSSAPVSRARHLPVVVLLVVLIASVLVADGADAAFPGENGKIAFGSGDIYVMNPDGSGQTNLTDDSALFDSEPAWSPDATKIAFSRATLQSDGNFGQYRIWVMDADGSNQTRVSTVNNDLSPAWSPDGAQIAFVNADNIWVMNADGSNRTRLTNNAASNESPNWSPDGTRIAFSSRRDGNAEVYVMDADGSNQTRLTDDPQIDNTPDWSPDGTRIAFTTTRHGDREIYVMDADGSNETRITNTAQFFINNSAPAWSPDGTRITFNSDRLNGGNVWVMDADGSNPMRISTVVGGGPDWQPLPEGSLPLTTTSTSTTSTTLPDGSAVGSAYGYYGFVSLLGGPFRALPCDPPPAPEGTNCGPTPSVTLPPTGGSVSETDPTGLAQRGPAYFLESGPVTASTSGTTGPDGSVTSSALVEDMFGAAPWSAEEISSTCTASADELSGSTNIAGGELIVEYDVETQEPIETITLPENPAPNTEYFGSIDYVNDDFRAVFNEQVVEDGVITVYAAHFYLLGANAFGDVWIGKSECGFAGSGTVPTTTTSSSLPPTTTTSSTLPTTTTSTSTTSTTLPTTTSTTSSTLPPTTTSTSTTSTTMPPTTTSTSTTSSTTLPPTTTTSTTAPPDGGLVVTIDDTVLTDGSRGQVSGSITCDAGTLFALDLDLTQDTASADGSARGSCTGAPQSFTVGFATTGDSFSDGPAQACIAARTGQAGSRPVIDSTEVCEGVEIDIRAS